MKDEIRIQREDFDVSVEAAALSEGGVGAVATFTGLVRSDDGLTAMTLEHYPGMTEREIARHIAKARRHWAITDARIVHRVGRLGPGEHIVFVGVSARHRKDAIAAVEFLIDYLKTRAPFWKEEERGDNKSWVAANIEDETRANRWR